ncbi:HD-GYP domain-containing protein [Serpentinicella alkaliphila]|uniref:Putative nucleotidyltransferase with HDIG domain n=1 Tax=Serpentinicella alkaliphila TaxID=1734049 RepID=A0A4R2TK18_9FIRM|nr:HD-GYP domain-containing protein [Serpentinicella alkaliphila]QUH24702.1 HD-GYP domain-containing protein [Serpentinicella alkaliphila]TCQ03691.1 putative nucleotidyltransferase with HDIG domain [Serpentinicella alkaliphila]
MYDKNIRLKIYTVSIILMGVACFLFGLKESVYSAPLEISFFILIGAITQSLQIRVKGNTAFSISFAIGLATVFIFSPSIVAVISFITMLIYIDRYNGKSYHFFNSDKHKRLFNASAYAIALALSSVVYNLVETNIVGIRLLGFSIIGIIASTLTYTAINPSIFIGLMCIIENKRYKDALREKVWPIINIIALSPLGVVTAIAYAHYGWFAVVMFLGPLLVARYSFKLYIDMKSVYFETIKALSNAVEAKDEYTKGHSYRVAQYAVGIAQEMGLTYEVVDKINTAAILHDIGKIGISDTILNKPDNLSDEEYIRVQNHPEIGAKILFEVDFLKDVAEIIKHHHERYDGKGYPLHLEGNKIPLEASILAVADAYDAMTSDRAYRKAMNSIIAYKIIIKESGKQFDPRVVESFMKYMKKQKNIWLEDILESEKVSYVS